MNARTFKTLPALALAAFVAAACGTGQDTSMGEAATAETATQMAPTNNVSGSLQGLHGVTSGHLRATADLVSADLYGFRPTDEVRSLGQILAHVAAAQYMFCSAAAGEQNPNAENFEETRTEKAQVVEALGMALDYCDQVYANMTDARGAEMVSFFGNDMAVSAVLAFNTAHNYEHYGNLVTYMRINGIVPPSSAGM